MNFQLPEKIGLENVILFILWVVFLSVAIIYLNKFILHVSSQSAYLKTLRNFADQHGVKKPISTGIFILGEIAGLILLMVLFVLFFRNTLLAGLIFAGFLTLAIFFGIKYYTPPLKAFAAAKKLTAQNDDMIFGSYYSRDIYIKKEEVPADYISNSLTNRHRINFKKKVISVSLSLDNGSIEKVTYEKGKIVTTPYTMKADFLQVEKMLWKIPSPDNPQLYVSIINGKKFITLEKISSSFLFLVELCYLCEITERILDSINEDVAHFPKNWK